jgi:hypothetical protein
VSSTIVDYSTLDLGRPMYLVKESTNVHSQPKRN